MKCEVRRLWETEASICGELWVDGQREAVTLEPARLNPVNDGHPAIPAGEYEIVLTVSPHLTRRDEEGDWVHYTTPEVLNVPDRTAIRWHIGNTPRDTLGCVLLGLVHKPDFVADSVLAFDRVFALLKFASDRGEKITAVYTEKEN